uniref:Uncharacterized protein n=1 Tax=Arundo donax TaxID=35708 RepID=A0A0A8YHI3_ARUDO
MSAIESNNKNIALMHKDHVKKVKMLLMLKPEQMQIQVNWYQ